MMYSAHDTQLAMVWEFLNPTNYDPFFIPYSSFIHMELFKDEKCNEKDLNACFHVLFSMNGEELNLDIPSCKHKTLCPYPEVRKFL